MSTSVKMSTLPKCSFCSNRAGYDFRTKTGQWAYGCDHHWRQNRMHLTLGTGKGQELVLE